MKRSGERNSSIVLTSIGRPGQESHWAPSPTCTSTRTWSLTTSTRYRTVVPNTTKRCGDGIWACPWDAFCSLSDPIVQPINHLFWTHCNAITRFRFSWLKDRRLIGLGYWVRYNWIGHRRPTLIDWLIPRGIRLRLHNWPPCPERKWANCRSSSSARNNPSCWSSTRSLTVP